MKTKHFLPLLTLLLTMLVVPAMSAAELTAVFYAQGTSVTLPSTQNKKALQNKSGSASTANNIDAQSLNGSSFTETNTGISVSFSNGTNTSSYPVVYNSNGKINLRLYSGNTMTVTAPEGYVVKSVKSNNTSDKWNPTYGTKTVDVTLTGAPKMDYFTVVVETGGSSGGGATAPAAPVFTDDSNNEVNPNLGITVSGSDKLYVTSGAGTTLTVTSAPTDACEIVTYGTWAKISDFTKSCTLTATATKDGLSTSSTLNVTLMGGTTDPEPDPNPSTAGGTDVLTIASLGLSSISASSYNDTFSASKATDSENITSTAVYGGRITRTSDNLIQIQSTNSGTIRSGVYTTSSTGQYVKSVIINVASGKNASVGVYVSNSPISFTSSNFDLSGATKIGENVTSTSTVNINGNYKYVAVVGTTKNASYLSSIVINWESAEEPLVVPTVTFNPADGSTVEDGDMVEVTVTPDTYGYIVTSNVATDEVADNFVAINGAGTHEINVTFTDSKGGSHTANATYTVEETGPSVVVPTITFNPADGSTVYDESTLTITINPSDYPMEIASSNENDLIDDAEGLVMFGGVGERTITVTYYDSEDEEHTATATYTVIAKPDAETLAAPTFKIDGEVVSGSVNVAMGDEVVVVAPAGASSVTLTATPASAATISGATATINADCVLTAQAVGDGVNYLSSPEVTLTVKAWDVAKSYVLLENKNDFVPGKSYVIATGNDGSVKVMSATKVTNKPIAGVDATVTNKVLALPEGGLALDLIADTHTDNVYFCYPDGAYLVKNATGSSSFTSSEYLNENNTKVELSSVDATSSAATLKLGGSYLMSYNSANFRLYGNTTQNNSALVYLYKEQGGKREAGISWGESSYEYKLNTAFEQPVFNNPNGLNVTFSSNNAAVVEINATTGAIELKGEGTATLTATFAGDKVFEAATVTCTVNVVNKLSATLTWSSDTYEYIIGDVLDLPTLTTNPEGIAVTLESSDTSVATIVDGAVTLTFNSGTTTITANFAGNAEWGAASASYELTVTSKLVFKKINSIGRLNETDEYLFVGYVESSNKYMSATTMSTGSTKFMQVDDIELADAETILLDEGQTKYEVFKLEYAGDNMWHIKGMNMNQYLYHTSTSNTINAGTKQDGGKGTFKLDDKGNFYFNIPTESRDLKFNPSNPRFAAYTGGQQGFSIYRRALGETDEYNLMLNPGVEIHYTNAAGEVEDEYGYMNDNTETTGQEFNAQSTKSHYVNIDLGSHYDIDEIVIAWDGEQKAKNYEIYVMNGIDGIGKEHAHDVVYLNDADGSKHSVLRPEPGVLARHLTIKTTDTEAETMKINQIYAYGRDNNDLLFHGLPMQIKFENGKVYVQVKLKAENGENVNRYDVWFVEVPAPEAANASTIGRLNAPKGTENEIGRTQLTATTDASDWIELNWENTPGETPDYKYLTMRALAYDAKGNGIEGYLSDGSVKGSLGESVYKVNVASAAGTTTGVENVGAGVVDGNAEYYNLQGMRISRPGAGQIVIRRQGANASTMLVK